METNETQVGQEGSYTKGGHIIPCTVIRVSKTGHRVTVQKDRSTWTERYGWAITRDDKGFVLFFTRGQDGVYRNNSGQHYRELDLTGWNAKRVGSQFEA